MSHHNNKRGRPISPPCEPVSPKRRSIGGAWNHDFNSNQTILPEFSNSLHSMPPIARKPLHQRTPTSARGNANAFHLFKKAIGAIHPTTSSTSTSKTSCRIRGVATQTCSDFIQTKGKARANETTHLDQIDLTKEIPPKNSLNPIDQVFENLPKSSKSRVYTYDSTNDESEDPLRIRPKVKRVDQMESRNHRPLKSLSQLNLIHPQQDSTTTPSPLLGHFVPLATVKFSDNEGHQTRFNFPNLQPLCRIHLDTPSNGPVAVLLTVDSENLPGPSKRDSLRIPCDQILKISIRIHHPGPSQMILHTLNTFQVQEASGIWNQVTLNKSSDTDLPSTPNTCFFETLHDSSMDEGANNLKTLVDLLRGYLPCLDIDQLDSLSEFPSIKEEQSDIAPNHFSLAKQITTKRTCTPETPGTSSDVSFQSLTCSASTSKLHTRPQILNSSFSNGPQISTKVYNASNSENSILKFQPKSRSNESTTKSSEQNPKKLEHLDNRNTHPNLRKTQASQAPLDSTLSPRYITRSTHPQQSIHSPLNLSSDRPPGISAHGVDSDIVLIWPYDDDRCSSSVAITKGDLKRLDDGEFLNDTLIEFGLKWELSEIQKNNPGLVASIHMFNSFFFQKLSSFKSNQKLTVSEEAKEAYAGVRKWTKGIDIFQKNFLVIPINEHMHWYFIIVSNPGKLLELHIQNSTPNVHPSPGPSIRTRQSQKFQAVEDSSTVKIKTTTPEEDPDGPKTSAYFTPHDIADLPSPTEKTDDQVGVNGSNVNSAVDKSTQGFKHMNLHDQNVPDGTVNDEAPKDKTTLPYVLTLDSLGTSHRAPSQTILRYLMNEADDKLQQTLPESLLKTVPVKKVSVPEQPNHCDCGLYLIHAFKTFFRKPDVMLKWTLDNPKRRPAEQRQNEVQTVWDAEGATQARKTLRAQVCSLIPQYQEKMKLKKAAADEKKKLEQTKTKKLPATDVPSTPTHHDSTTKKLRVIGPDPNKSIRPHLSASVSNSLQNCSLGSTASGINPESSCSSRKSRRFLENNTRSQAEKDEIYASCMKPTATPVPVKDSAKKPQGTTNSSRIPTSHLTISDDGSDGEKGKNWLTGSSRTSTKKDVEVRNGSGRSVTPDEELMLESEYPRRDRQKTAPNPTTSDGSPPKPVLKSTHKVVAVKQKAKSRMNDEECPAEGPTAAVINPGNADYDGEPLEEGGVWKHESGHPNSSNEISIRCLSRPQTNSHHQPSHMKVDSSLFESSQRFDPKGPLGLRSSSFSYDKQHNHSRCRSAARRNKKAYQVQPLTSTHDPVIKMNGISHDRAPRAPGDTTHDSLVDQSSSLSSINSSKSHHNHVNVDIDNNIDSGNNIAMSNTSNGGGKKVDKDTPTDKSSILSSPSVQLQLDEGNPENPVMVDD